MVLGQLLRLMRAVASPLVRLVVLIHDGDEDIRGGIAH
jgi:hypothetical protein